MVFLVGMLRRFEFGENVVKVGVGWGMDVGR